MDLTLDDLVRWQPGRFRTLQPEADPRAALAVELSWAAMIRAGTPVLPAVRGGELIIVPAARLRELREREHIGWRQILEQLALLKPSGVLTDDRSVEPVPGLIFLFSDEPIPDDLEARLNREIIERRGDLYALGSELARELSAASIRGLELEALLAIAAQVGEIDVALVAGSGAVIARSHPDVLPEGLPLDPDRLGIPFPHGGRDWVSHPVRSLALPEGVVLVGGIEPEAPADRARLVLEQTAESLGMLFDRLPPVKELSPQREIERLLEQIIVQGTLTPVGRRRFNHMAAELRLEGPLRLLALPGGGERRGGSARELRFRHAGLEFLVTSDARFRETLRAGERLVASEPVENVEDLAAQLPAVRAAAELLCAGVLAGGVVDLAEPAVREAPLALLLAGLASDRAARALRAFADARLAALDAYDRERGAELVKTLEAYLLAGASVAGAAEALGVHRNTLAYRIARIEEVGELDLDDPATRFDLHLALVIRHVLPGEP